jgi:hypothetical protein
MRSKFSTLFLASAALAAAALATIPAMASTSESKLNVPFSFTIDGQSLPAGEYSVLRDDDRNFVKLQSKDSSRTFIWLARAASSSTDRVILKFEPQGDTHALQSIQYGPLVTSRLTKKSKRMEDVSPQIAPGL